VLGSLPYQSALQVRNDRLRAAEQRRILVGPRARTRRALEKSDR
jgi:hypothetical protein